MNPEAFEVNFDGLVGPTHHYAGLSPDNRASQQHRGRIANPKAAALEGLAKMQRLMARGVAQAVLPPHERPAVDWLRAVGFSGDDAAVLDAARRHAPRLLHAAGSASAMWTANAATVSPSSDTADGRVHLTPANLVSTLHRSIECGMTTRLLRTVFADGGCFVVHDPLPATAALADEGAANHSRLCPRHGEPGIELLVHSRPDAGSGEQAIVEGRQTLAASQAIARLHQLDPSRVVFVQQHPDAVAAGVFHHDVIGVANEHVMLLHERAWVDQPKVLDALSKRYEALCGGQLSLMQVSEADLPLRDAVACYLFNSQLITLEHGGMLLLAPAECRDMPAAAACIDRWLRPPSPLSEVEYVDLRQSMLNGGGPACLRCRVVLTAQQWAAVHPGVKLTPTLCTQLREWIERHYRDSLVLDDLADPQLQAESRAALDELSNLLGLGAIYPFQR